MKMAEPSPRAGGNLDADIVSIYLARLDGLFDRRVLGLHEGALPEHGFLARIGKAEFWACALCKKGQRYYGRAAHAYLQRQFPNSAAMSFEDDCRTWAKSFYAARDDADSLRDLLLLFLDQNLVHLKRLYILEQPGNRDLGETQAIARCCDEPSNALLFVGERFARWVLDDWLPFHLRHVCCRDFLAGQATPEPGCAHSAIAGVSVVCN